MFCLSPARRFGLELSFEGVLAVLRLLQGRLVALLLVGQLLGQAVTLQDQGVVLGFLGAKGGLGPAELPPQVGISSCKHEDKGKINKEEFVREDPTRLLSSRPQSRGLHPVDALTRPHRR